MILNLKDFGTFLSTRDLGEIIRNKITTGIKEGNIVTVDFTDITQMTHSCADEVFAKLVIEFGLSNFKKFVKMKNADETTATIIKYAIARRLQNQNGHSVTS